MSTEIHKEVEEFADRLRTARKAKTLGQTELAEKIGVSAGSVGNWEIGSSQPRPETLRKLAAVLEVRPAWLLYGESPLPEYKPGLGHSEPAKYSSAQLHDASNPLPEGTAGRAGGTAPTDDLLRLKCREHFEVFLARCANPAQLGWLYCELQEHFPLTKFEKSPVVAANSAAASGAEALLDALGEAEPSAAPLRRRKR